MDDEEAQSRDEIFGWLESGASLALAIQYTGGEFPVAQAHPRDEFGPKREYAA